jgi:cytochrome c oxidase subunit 4
MSTHHVAEHELEHAHPGAKTYVLIGVVLAIITVAEVFFYTQESVRTFLVPLLLVLSASKFALVIGFYMHLKFDHHHRAAVPVRAVPTAARRR